MYEILSIDADNSSWIWSLCGHAGAYTRLTHSGLGCPDWPGCYGHLTVPQPNAELATAYPDAPLEPAKAWYEMIHRYAAGTLGLLLISVACLGIHHFKGRYKIPHIALLCIVILQAFLGKWTVTWKRIHWQLCPI